MKKLKTLTLLLTVILYGNFSTAQISSRLDQYYLDPSVINPAALTNHTQANAGMFFSRAFSGLPGGPVNTLLNVALPSADQRKAFGVYYLRENAGFSTLQNAYASYAYGIPVGDESKLSLGVSLGLLNQSFDMSKAVYIQKNDPTVLSLMFSPAANRVDLRASAFFTGNGFSAGLSTSRLPKPRFDYSYYNYGAKYSLQNITTLYLGYDWEISDNAKLKPSVMLTAYDLNYLRYQGNITYTYMDRFWLGISAGDAAHMGGNIGFKPQDGISVGYQVNFQTALNAKVLGPVHEFYLGIGLGSLGSGVKAASDATTGLNSNVDQPAGGSGIIKRRYKEVTLQSLTEFEVEGLDLDTSGISFAAIDKEKKLTGIFLVAGLHSDEAKANKQIKDLYMRGIFSYKFFDPVNKSYYVFLKEFDTQAEASRYIMDNDTGLPQAWIREVK